MATTVKRILIVDDEEKVVFFLREALSGTGGEYEVLGVRSGVEALPKLSAQHYDLLITDQRMPGMTGIELLEKVRQCSPETQLIIMTAYGTPELLEAAERLKVIHFFNKPFRIQELIEVVQQALGIPTVNRLGDLELSEDHRDILTESLANLCSRVNAQYAMLIDTTGQMLATAGPVGSLDIAAFATLIAGDYITNVKMAQRIQQHNNFHFKYYGGELADIASAGVNDEALLGLVLPPQSSNCADQILKEVQQATLTMREILEHIAENTHPAPAALNHPEAMLVSQPAALSSSNGNAHSLIGIRPNTAPVVSPASAVMTNGSPTQADVETVYKLLALEASRERQRLAREIHDGPTQIFVNSIFEISFLEEVIGREPDKLKLELSRLKETFQQGLEEMRRFMFDLRLPVLDTMTLPEALGWLCADFQKRTKVEVLLNAEGMQQRLPSHVEGTVLKIVQEALHNIQKHARATLVTVSAQTKDEHMTLLIADNGKGFNMKTGSKESGVGLGSMEERAQMIKGDLRMESAPGKGTRIWVTVPIP